MFALPTGSNHLIWLPGPISGWNHHLPILTRLAGGIYAGVATAETSITSVPAAGDTDVGPRQRRFEDHVPLDIVHAMLVAGPNHFCRHVGCFNTVLSGTALCGTFRSEANGTGKLVAHTVPDGVLLPTPAACNRALPGHA